MCHWLLLTWIYLEKLLGEKMVNEIDYFVPMPLNFFDEEFCNIPMLVVLQKWVTTHFQDPTLWHKFWTMAQNAICCTEQMPKIHPSTSWSQARFFSWELGLQLRYFTPFGIVLRKTYTLVIGALLFSSTHSQWSFPVMQWTEKEFEGPDQMRTFIHHTRQDIWMDGWEPYILRGCFTITVIYQNQIFAFLIITVINMMPREGLVWFLIPTPLWLPPIGNGSLPYQPRRLL